MDWRHTADCFYFLFYVTETRRLDCQLRTLLWLQWHFLEDDTCNCINVASVTVLQGVFVLIALLMRLFRSLEPLQPLSPVFGTDGKLGPKSHEIFFHGSLGPDVLVFGH